MELKNNTYWVLRHGRSLANEAGIIVSSLDNGVKPEYALSETGREQARAAGRQLAAELAAAGLGPGSVLAVASPFSRTLETARLAIAAAGAGDAPLEVAPELRERFFGAALELQSHDGYCPAWEADAADPTSRPGGGDGESCEDVAKRVSALLQDLERRHSGRAIVLVSHGDTLSITLATAQGGDLGQHRQNALGTAELRQLRGSGSGGDSGGGDAAAADKGAEKASSKVAAASVVGALLEGLSG